MLKNVFLYAHGGSKNHGCEAIVRTTLQLLNDFGNKILISSRPDEDVLYGLNDMCTILPESNRIEKSGLDFLSAYYKLKVQNNYVPMERLRYKKAFSHVKKDDLALSIGGDNYCYADVEKYIMFHQMAKDRGAKTVLWGCSVEPKVVEKEKIARDLQQYDLITARESLSYEALRRVNHNTILVSDSAFWLPTEKTAIPAGFAPENTVGINVSPLVISSEALEGIVKKNYEFLIDVILRNTDMNVALIPHVIWEDSDDRIPLQNLFEQYKDTNRVCFVSDQNCMKLKYLISKCRFLVGARTHATIAAYSSLVPTLVLGYSIKSKGICKDLFGQEDQYIIPVSSLKKESDLADAFVELAKNEEVIKHILNQKLLEQENNKQLITKAVSELING